MLNMFYKLWHRYLSGLWYILSTAGSVVINKKNNNLLTANSGVYMHNMTLVHNVGNLCSVLHCEYITPVVSDLC